MRDISVGDRTISAQFGSIFVGQQVGSDLNSLSDSTPDGPLMLDPNGPAVATLIDLSTKSVVVGGYEPSGDSFQYFGTPISILFSHAIHSVGFTAGAYDQPSGVFVEAYDADGNVLGRIANQKAGTDEIGIATPGGDRISGITMFLEPGTMDWEGFGIDNLVLGELPEPSAWIVWSGLGLIAAVVRGVQRKRR